MPEGTTILADGDQRQSPIERIGLVIGTCGTVPYVHLQLEQCRRMFGVDFWRTMPTLVVNDGNTDDQKAGLLASLCREYQVDFHPHPHIGHATGDLRVFADGLVWAESRCVDLLVKLSRRYVPLVSWRMHLMALASVNQHAAAFGRRNGDRADGMFRTDCIALRVRKWRVERVREIFAETMKRDPMRTMIEPLMLSLVKVLGGWEMWNLVGEDMHRPCPQAMQWRGLMPWHYADLARSLGLAYTDEDFIEGTLTRALTVMTPARPLSVSGGYVVDGPVEANGGVLEKVA